ncbi:hypothetical protein FQZ97_692500 [compost metagenome]
MPTSSPSAVLNEMEMSGPACIQVRTTRDRPIRAATMGTSQIHEIRLFCLREIEGEANFSSPDPGACSDIYSSFFLGGPRGLAHFLASAGRWLTPAFDRR